MISLLFWKPCSDGNNPTELHAEDYCLAGSTLFINDATGTISGSAASLCEQEIGSLCPPGWLYYKDDGTEGTDSCIQRYPVVGGNWNRAMCGFGSHLVTFRGSSKTSGLSALVTASGTGSSWLGCVQSGSSSQVARGWTWVDGTPADNLNCGTETGGSGCGLWSASEPKYVA